MEIRTESRTGRLVPSTADVTTALGRRLNAVKQQWLDQLARDPGGFGRLEVEIHEEFRRLADEMTASVLAEVPASSNRAEPGKKGGLARPTSHDVPRKSGG